MSSRILPVHQEAGGVAEELGLFAQADIVPACQLLHIPGARIVAGLGIFGAGITQPDNQFDLTLSRLMSSLATCHGRMTQGNGTQYSSRRWRSLNKVRQGREKPDRRARVGWLVRGFRLLPVEVGGWRQAKQNRHSAVLSNRVYQCEHGRDGLFVADTANRFSQHGGEVSCLTLPTAFISGV